MTDNLNFTIKQLACLFCEGVNRGHAEASSFEWGTRVGSSWQDAFADALETLVNDNKEWDDPTLVSWETIRHEWMKNS